ncbi:MAG: general secretion pathway protein GspB [Candidatus Obscuribacterales bacterium]|nr:general secretion pathway protein GspB [Steroidobacteraceae bacterium]
MSFILDALRKSESERQRLGGASIADLPVGQRPARPWWVIALAILLAANLALLIIVMLRPAATSSSNFSATTLPASVSPKNSMAPSASLPTLAAQAPATANAPTSSLADAAASPAQVEYDLVDRETLDAASAIPEGPTLVKSLEANGAQPTSLADLRLDMHVYSPQRAERFVFINMRKYTEGQNLTEGPSIDQITADGVVLSYRGSRWQLERP